LHILNTEQVNKIFSTVNIVRQCTENVKCVEAAICRGIFILKSQRASKEGVYKVDFEKTILPFYISYHEY